MVLTATLGFQKGCTTLSFDETNVFDSIYRYRMLLALADVIPVAT